MKLPGAEAFSEELNQRLETALTKKGDDYRPRTRHVHDDNRAKYINRLIFSQSPYLLQHAHNPVNWFSFGDEAFAKAESLNRPVLLSIGYATCHWCHVMEEESFEDEEIARYLNEHYVCIKVDREERPDVDAIYMAATQAINGHGGWPMTVWLKPDQTPFYAATYFPARDGDRGMRTGFLTVLQYFQEAFARERESIDAAAKRITEALLYQFDNVQARGLPTRDIISGAVKLYRSRFDGKHGGVRGAPKFPSTMPVRLLLREYIHCDEAELLDMALITLKEMSQGGIYDQIGGGFHRYSVDDRWLVPHFEKMLYDNALLVSTYVETYLVSKNEWLKSVAIDSLRYVMREMTAIHGAFFSATDADSLGPDGHCDEGFFFTWTCDEMKEHFGSHDADVIMEYFGVTADGNFEGRNVLHRSKEIAEIATQFHRSSEDILDIIRNAKAVLLKARSIRHHPLCDEKIITSWNGLMISAFAKAGFAFDEPAFVAHAERAATFIVQTLMPDATLRRFFRERVSEQRGFLDDYAFLIAGLLDLYEAGGDVQWLSTAIRLDEVLHAEFEDHQRGGFFLASMRDKKLIAQEKPNHDGAEPSGNSVAILNLLRLHQFCDDPTYKQRAEKALQAFSTALTDHPMSSSEMLIALDFYWSEQQQIAIITDAHDSGEALVKELRNRFLPHSVKTIVKIQDTLNHPVPWLQQKTLYNNKATAYVCREGTCKLPTVDSRVLAEQLSRQ